MVPSVDQKTPQVRLGMVFGHHGQHHETDSLAVFGSLAYDLTDSLTGQVGLRYTDESKDLTARREVSPFGAPPINPPTVSASPRSSAST